MSAILFSCMTREFFLSHLYKHKHNFFIYFLLFYVVRYCDIERLTNERERMFNGLKLSADKNEQKLCMQVKLLQQKCEECELTLKRTEWDFTDQLNGKKSELQQ